MQCPACRTAGLVHDTRDMLYEYDGVTTVIPQVSGDYCPACGEVIPDLDEGDRVCESILQLVKRATHATANEKPTTNTTRRIIAGC